MITSVSQLFIQPLSNTRGEFQYVWPENVKVFEVSIRWVKESFLSSSLFYQVNAACTQTRSYSASSFLSLWFGCYHVSLSPLCVNAAASFCSCGLSSFHTSMVEGRSCDSGSPYLVTPEAAQCPPGSILLSLFLASNFRRSGRLCFCTCQVKLFGRRWQTTATVIIIIHLQPPQSCWPC